MYLLILNLQEEQDRQAAERRRQAELARLRREKRQAERCLLYTSDAADE